MRGDERQPRRTQRASFTTRMAQKRIPRLYEATQSADEEGGLIRSIARLKSGRGGAALFTQSITTIGLRHTGNTLHITPPGETSTQPPRECLPGHSRSP